MKLILSIILFLLFISCEKPSSCDKYYFSAEFKMYLMKKAGTSWLYVDSINHCTDSVTLVEHNLSFDNRCTPYTQPQEVLNQRIKSSFFFGDSLIHVLSYAFDAYYNALQDYKYSRSIGFFDDRDHHGFTSSWHLDSITINNNTYKNIKVFSFTFNTTKDPELYYWAEDVGLIRKYCYKPFSQDSILYHFDLLRYHAK